MDEQNKQPEQNKPEKKLSRTNLFPRVASKMPETLPSWKETGSAPF